MLPYGYIAGLGSPNHTSGGVVSRRNGTVTDATPPWLTASHDGVLRMKSVVYVYVCEQP